MRIFVKPMLCRQVEDIKKLPPYGEYLYQDKLDGTRIILKFRVPISPEKPKEVIIQNRRFDNLQFRYPELSPDVVENSFEKDRVFSIVLDGELIGQTGNFNDILERDTLTNSLMIKVRAREKPLTFFAFDLLEVNGVNHRNMPLKFRIKTLKYYVKGNERVKVLPTYEKPPSMEGKEGIIAKRSESSYYEGVRSPMWWKIKNWERVKAQITGWRYGDRGKKVVLITPKGDVSCPSMALQEKYLKEKPKYALVRHLAFKQQKDGCWRQPVLEGFV